MRRVKILFERQRAILGTGAMIGVRDALLEIGAEWGLSAQQVMAALTDPAGGQRVTRISQSAAALGVNHTPSFLFNGVLNDDHAFLTREGMARMLDTRLAQL
jgi:predicted DsbA family dithiol-disulfide isomerase